MVHVHCPDKEGGGSLDLDPSSCLGSFLEMQAPEPFPELQSQNTQINKIPSTQSLKSTYISSTAANQVYLATCDYL